MVLSLVLFERKPGVAMRRNLLAEWFFIEQGKIRSIYASMYYPGRRGYGAELAALRRQLAGRAGSQIRSCLVPDLLYEIGGWNRFCHRGGLPCPHLHPMVVAGGRAGFFHRRRQGLAVPDKARREAHRAMQPLVQSRSRWRGPAVP